MSIFSNILGHRRRNYAAEQSRAAMDTSSQQIIPVGLDDAHSFTEPTATAFTELPYGIPQYSDQLGKDLPDIPNQDRILVHWFRPAAYTNPQRWYNDRNEDTIYRGTQEHFFTSATSTEQSQKRAADNPWLGSTPTNNYHVNAQKSPSTYRFIRPFDQRWERTNTLAQSGSQAQVAFPQPVGGMRPAYGLRNTFRLAPAARDLENLDINSTHVAAVQPAVYVSPQVQSSRWGL